jgi:Leucine-rich repeat (LRR) protein
MSECENLERLPNSFGNLVRLVYLNLKHCKNLTISNETLGNISSLQYIDLSYCKKIEVLPPQVAHQRSLEILILEGTNLKELPSAIGDLSRLAVLQLGSPLLDTLLPRLGDLRNLKELRLEDCEELKCLPASVGLLSQLTTFKVRDCPLSELSLKRVIGERETLSNLDSSIERCLPRLQFLSMFNTEISKVSFAKAVCSNFQHFIIDHCNALVEVEILPNTLIKLELISCSNLKKIGGLCGLSKLEELNICAKLKSIRGLARVTNLRLLDVMYCLDLEALPKVEHCISLERLTVFECPKLQWGQGIFYLLPRLKEYRVDITGFTFAK